MFVVLQPPSKDMALCLFYELWDFDPTYYYPLPEKTIDEDFIFVFLIQFLSLAEFAAFF